MRPWSPDFSSFSSTARRPWRLECGRGESSVYEYTRTHRYTRSRSLRGAHTKGNVTSEIFCILARAYVPMTNVHTHVLIITVSRNVCSSVSVNAEKKERKKEEKKRIRMRSLNGIIRFAHRDRTQFHIYSLF